MSIHLRVIRLHETCWTPDVLVTLHIACIRGSFSAVTFVLVLASPKKPCLSSMPVYGEASVDNSASQLARKNSILERDREVAMETKEGIYLFS